MSQIPLTSSTLDQLAAVVRAGLAHTFATVSNLARPRRPSGTTKPSAIGRCALGLRIST